MKSFAIELTTAEWAIFKAVCDREPCTAPDVQEALFAETKWTYSTVKTMMDRLVAKKILGAKKLRNLTLYTSAVRREAAQQSHLTALLRNVFNGATTPMVQCLLDQERLSDAELDELEKLIQSKRTGKKL